MVDEETEMQKYSPLYREYRAKKYAITKGEIFVYGSWLAVGATVVFIIAVFLFH